MKKNKRKGGHLGDIFRILPTTPPDSPPPASYPHKQQKMTKSKVLLPAWLPRRDLFPLRVNMCCDRSVVFTRLLPEPRGMHYAYLQEYSLHKLGWFYLSWKHYNTLRILVWSWELHTSWASLSSGRSLMCWGLGAWDPTHCVFEHDHNLILSRCLVLRGLGSWWKIITPSTFHYSLCTELEVIPLSWDRPCTSVSPDVQKRTWGWG